MAAFQVARNYFAVYRSQPIALAEGTVVDIDDVTADWVNRDSPGCLVPTDTAPAVEPVAAPAPAPEIVEVPVADTAAPAPADTAPAAEPEAAPAPAPEVVEAPVAETAAPADEAPVDEAPAEETVAETAEAEADEAGADK